MANIYFDRLTEWLRCAASVYEDVVIHVLTVCSNERVGSNPAPVTRIIFEDLKRTQQLQMGRRSFKYLQEPCAVCGGQSEAGHHVVPPHLRKSMAPTVKGRSEIFMVCGLCQAQMNRLYAAYEKENVTMSTGARAVDKYRRLVKSICKYLPERLIRSFEE